MIRGFRAGFLSLLGTIALPALALGQQATADSAWAAGDFKTARLNYERVLQQDPGSVRANYRLGILASWDGRLDSALVLIRRARWAEPGEPDIQLTEATVLGWASRYAEADSVYRDLLARHPENQSAAAGRAQLLAWQGELDRAVDAYLAILAEHPDNIQARVGLGQVYLWQEKPDLAREQSARALQVDPTDPTARAFARTVAQGKYPSPEITLGWSHDSDDNTNWWQTIAASLLVANRLRVFGSFGVLEATDPLRTSTRIGGEAGVILGVSDWRLTGALGVRQLLPGGAPDRAEATYRAGAGYHVSRSTDASLSYAHYPFDETALLMGLNLDVDALDLGIDVRLRPDLTLSGGGGYTWFSDTNSRSHAFLAATKTLPHNFTAGLFARAMGYDFDGFGYFSPERFILFEGRGSHRFKFAAWRGRVGAGLGVQQIDKGTSAQLEGHLEGRIGRNWSGDNSVEAFAGFSTSAESSTTGAFRYYTAGLVITIVF